MSYSSQIATSRQEPIHVSLCSDSDTVGDKKPHPNRTRPLRPTANGFLPLPAISASPVCTPSTSTTSHELSSLGSLSSEQDRDSSDGYTTAPVCSANPTWISIPPTPPPKLFRRSVTCVARISSAVMPPSASFPPTNSPRVAQVESLASTTVPLNRRATLPLMSSGHYFSNPSTMRRNNPENMLLVESPLRSRFSATHHSILSTINPRSSFGVSHEVTCESDDGADKDNMRPVESQQYKDKYMKEKEKDDVRRYHALMELLSTEVSYLADLKALILAYLGNLPNMSHTANGSAVGRNSSFTRSRPSPRTNPVSISIGSNTRVLRPMASIDPESSMRPLFTSRDILLLKRNAEDILKFHEQFVEELRCALTPLGFTVAAKSSFQPNDHSDECVRNVNVGIAIVSAKFATEASRFNLYQEFCAGHPEALDVVHRIQDQRPSEWRAFEQRSSQLATDIIYGEEPRASIETHSPIDETPQEVFRKKRKRANSLPSIDGIKFMGSKNFKDLSPVGRKDSRSSRLTFIDYMIKPIQRICKYPLILDQLKSSHNSRKFLRSSQHDNVVVDSATQAMRHVAYMVDEARHKQGVAVQTSLILSRICVATPLPTASSSQNPSFEVLTPSFLSSLGTCLLAGSLDVVYQKSSKLASTSTNAKYLGAFLYLGGYFILAKIKGKTYEPRHWFRLSEFEMIDVKDDDAMIPFSLRLRNASHNFEIGASCQKEKVAWVSSIRESLLHPSHSWINEPIPSLYLNRRDTAFSSFDNPFESSTPLQTIQSIPESTSRITPPTKKFTLKPNTSSTSFTEIPPQIRRSSTTSVKAMFMDTDTILIRRSSAVARSQVDLGLSDVISEPCLSARSHAMTRSEELFQKPTLAKYGFPSRSNSGLGMKSRLKRHESVRVPRKSPTYSDVHQVVNRAKTIANRTPKKHPSTFSEGDCIVYHPNHESTRVPSLFSSAAFQRNSDPASTSSSPLNSPNRDSTFFPRYDLPFDDTVARRSRPNSILSGMFSSRPVSPYSMTESLTVSPSEVPLTPAEKIKRWVKHHRSRSAPNTAPNTEVAPERIPQHSPVLPRLYFAQDLTNTERHHGHFETQHSHTAANIAQPPPLARRRKSMIYFITRHQ